MIHIKHEEIDDYDYGDNLDKTEDPFTLDERYYEDETYRCPECGGRMIKYFESYEAYGNKFRIPVYECGNCGFC